MKNDTDFFTVNCSEIAQAQASVVKASLKFIITPFVPCPKSAVSFAVLPSILSRPDLGDGWGVSLMTFTTACSVGKGHRRPHCTAECG